MEVDSILGSLSITDDFDQLVDVTSLFDELCSKLKPEAIVKDPRFDLFEGTHSLEVNNSKLDSSLIELTAEEIEFDVNVAYDPPLASVTAIADRLLRCVISWLNDYQTLPTTVLSCRYTESLLSSLVKGTTAGSSWCTGNILYDKVLGSCILGVCYLTKFVQKLLSAGIVFEEEDLNFNNMGFNTFDNLPGQDVVINSLTESLQILEAYSDDSLHLTMLKHILKIIICLVHLEDHLTDYSTKTSHLDELIENANSVNGIFPQLQLSPPKGAFSTYIQKHRSNKFPPRKITKLPTDYSGFITLANDVKTILLVDKAESALETYQFAKFFNKLEQRHVIARILFPLFFIRDDRTVLGKFSYTQFYLLHVKEFSAQTPSEFESSIGNELIQESSNLLLEWYQNCSQNTCRYRQGFNRQLILWDSLQAQFESVNSQVYCSWTYFMKLSSMIEFSLKGFDLDIYKPFEAYSMFWYVYYLSHHLETFLKDSQNDIESNINAIHSMNKKLKKLKAGEKKDQLRLKYRFAMDNEMEQLQATKQFLNYLLKEINITKSLCLIEVFQFAILKSFGLIDNKDSTPSKFSNERLIHNLRFKPFNSIGVPELPEYEVFQQTLKDFVIEEKGAAFDIKLERATNFIETEVRNVVSSIDEIMQGIKGGDNNGVLVTGTRLVQELSLEYYCKLKHTSKALSVNSKVIVNTLKKNIKNKDSHEYKVELVHTTEGWNYFPIQTLRIKQDRYK
ncbi:ANL_HP_G0073960.mRNA.1.CDS.1 [Saccharomyces cerevisiae]|nr:ANL_HP_G0199560.mRNA.1.CDS.1 [Saccharomyces cerevisiae]CAI5023867.1 ANL_HP_G0073960.mRNA.1.CDS.1 [Saccharomyces cerevisiae]CAI6460615.1 ANL_HP_G0199560.mRNA.1.CDS.1 [Saccharomyces cerevisiae]CAI6940928.1 ANL_HP_G0073960.mRNA.1.CDS.1 [Saccharomyces cerevisiae]